MSTLYPWQQALWQQHMPAALQRHHALLLRGPRGVGKRRFAEVLARSALCTAPRTDALPCGQCQACSWIAQSQHPDLFVIEPRIDSEAEGESAAAAKKAPAQIKVDQIRALVGALALSTHQGGRRLVLLEPAESMNANAANALLKSLEEPPAGTVFVLVTHQRGVLPATIISRCRALELALPPREQALAWLRQAGVEDAEVALARAAGAPLLALAQAAPEVRARLTAMLVALQQGSSVDPIAQAERWMHFSAAEIVESMQTWGHDLLARKLGREALYHIDATEALARTATQARVEDLLSLHRKLIDAKRLAGHPLNTRLLAEDLLLAYRGACGG